jgi:catechol 2,3-dioxygenase
MLPVYIDVQNYPDGNGVEIYHDRPEDEWPRPPDGGGVAMVSKPLDLQALMAEADGA